MAAIPQTVFQNSFFVQDKIVVLNNVSVTQIASTFVYQGSIDKSASPCGKAWVQTDYGIGDIKCLCNVSWVDVYFNSGKNGQYMFI